MNNPRPNLLYRPDENAAYLKGLAVVLLCTSLAHLLRPYLSESNLVMIYLLGVILVSSRYGRGPSMVTAILSVGTFDFFFVVPHLTFAVADSQHLVTFGGMFSAALVISTLTDRLRRQVQVATRRERDTAALYAMSRDMASTRGLDNLVQTALHHLYALFDEPVGIWLPDDPPRFCPYQRGHATLTWGTEAPVATRWVYDHGRTAGVGQDMWAESDTLYLPLIASRGRVGVLAIRPNSPFELLAPEPWGLLETMAAQTALALERARLSEESERSRIQMKSEQLRNALLSSVSHDLRTPLATITGAASTLLQDGPSLPDMTRVELAQAIHDEGNRLNRLLSNLLDMTRLESGAVQVRKEWYPLEEVIGAALARLDSQLEERPVTTQVEEELCLIPLDEVLIEQVLINLLENALKYTPAGSPIHIGARGVEGAVLVEVADRGPGLVAGEEQRLFDKFYRGRRTDSRQGVGLGLTIARAIVAAHGGTIWAETRPHGGARFAFTLPSDEQPPTITEEVSDAEASALDGRVEPPDPGH